MIMHTLTSVFQGLEKMGRVFSNPWKIGLSVAAVLIVQSASAGIVGWTCGGQGVADSVLLCTTNGSDWFRQGVGQIGPTPLSGVAAINGRHVWVVGDPEDGYASVYYSPDAGATWTRQGTPDTLPTSALHKAWAVDRDIVWAVGPDGAVVMTDDGGANWNDVSLPDCQAMLQGVTAVDQYTAWVSGEPDPASGFPALFYTQDGGGTWTPQTNGLLVETDHLLGLYALDANRVWAIGGHETVLSTTNAGAIWELEMLGTSKDGNEIEVLDDEHVWAAFDSHVNWSTNGGATWDYANTADYTMDVSTPDGTNIWAIANGYYGGIIYHSPDSGATWTNQAESNAWMGLTTITIQHAPEPRTLHVDAASSNASPPYDSWATAASNIQDAVAAADEGDVVLVTNGIYDRGTATPPSAKLPCRVMIADAVTVRSVNGPDGTVIAGEGPSGPDAVRGAYVGGGGRLIGFTITNGHVFLESHGLGYDRNGGGVLQSGAGLVSNCVITGNDGSGAMLAYASDVPVLGPPQLVDCLVRGNQAVSGAGIAMQDAGAVRRCQILSNTAFGFGGGVYLTAAMQGRSCVLENCLIAGNRATDEQSSAGGGVNAGGAFSIRHCTIVENTTVYQAGGAFLFGNSVPGESEVVDSIIYNNSASQAPNFYTNQVEVTYTCSTPLPSGEGNIADDPLVIGVLNPHIASASPCRGAGTTNGVPADDTDIDGEPRVVGGQTDIGCDQYMAASITGALTTAILAPYRDVLVDIPLDMAADIEGKAISSRWLIGTNGGTRLVSNTVHVTQAWPAEGTYTVRLEAVNLDLAAGTDLVVRVWTSVTNYASPGGGNVYPYTNWAGAATSLAAAVEACPAGGTVLAATGVYFEADTVSLTKPIFVQGFGGAGEVRVDGQGEHACFYINHPLAVLSNLALVGGYSMDQGGGAYVRNGWVTHCVIQTNYAASEGGGLRCWGATRVEYCEVSGNSAGRWGGGIMADENAVIRNCFIRDNEAHNYGGGANISDGVLLQNSFVAGNRSFGGGGIHLDGGGLARNCTVLKNMAVDSGGGVLFRSQNTGEVCNCIVYHNEAPVGPNMAFDVAMTGAVDHTCSWPTFAGAGNITNEPALLGLGNPHIVAASPCINAGSTGDLHGLEQDIDDEQRVYNGQVDMGCDEFIETNILGPLTIAILGETQVVAGGAAELFADIGGKAWGSEWLVADIGATGRYPNTFQIEPAWAAAGYYEVTLSASNLATSGAATVVVHVVEGGFTNYVSPGGSHESPFTNWVTAATNLQAAIDACYVGGVVMVRTGEYFEGRTLELAKPIAVLGAGDREECILNGDSSYRVININHPRAVLSGFTVMNGTDDDAAGVYMLEGTVSNCVIADNVSTVVGGGMRCAGAGLLTDSLVTGNTSPNWPGGIFLSGRATVRRCVVEENMAQNEGGGIYVDQGGSVTDCVLRGNSAAKGGGVYLHYDGTVTHSVIHSNNSANGAGAFLYYGGTVSNCDLTWNWGQMDGGGLWFNHGGLVTDSRIQNNFADENAGSGGGAVLSGGGVLRRCDVSTNQSSSGAGVYSQYGGLIDASYVHHNISPAGWGIARGAGVILYGENTIRNSLLERNNSANAAGGLLMLAGGTALNCTIARNTASNAVGGMALGGGSEMFNCIVYHNTAPAFPNWDVDAGVTVDHSCTTPDSALFDAAVTSDPLFAGVADFRLLSNSPCVNAGLNDEWMNGASDLAGAPRIRTAVVDIGAYESAYWGMTADVDGDTFSDWTEVGITGTDPTNGASFLGLAGPGSFVWVEGLIVRWQSVTGKFYNVDRGTNLVDNPTFTNWLTGVPGLPDFTTVTDITATATGAYFYRIGINSP